MTTEQPEQRLATALSDVTEQTQQLVRAEIASARGELMAKARQSLPAAAMLGAAAGCGLMAAASAYRLSLRLLEHAVGDRWGSTVATVGYGAAAAALATAGARALRSAPMPFPTETVRATGDAVRR